MSQYLNHYFDLEGSKCQYLQVLTSLCSNAVALDVVGCCAQDDIDGARADLGRQELRGAHGVTPDNNASTTLYALQ